MGARAVGASSRGTHATGAMAIGALAVGALAIGRLAIRRAVIRQLRIEELEVGRLRVRELDVEQERRPGRCSGGGQAMRTAVRPETRRAKDRAARRLLPIAGAYLPAVVTGTVLSFFYDVAARPGGDPRADIAFRGTALAPPLFLPVSMVGGAALARAPGRAGMIGTAIAGGVGLAYFLGGTVNLPNDLKAARAAGSPPALTAAMGAIAAGFGLGLAGNAAAALAGTSQRG